MQCTRTDNLGLTNTRNFTVTVNSQTTCHHVIVANVTPINGTAPLTSTFTNNVSDDQQVFSVIWLFGDGQSQNVAANAQFTHTLHPARHICSADHRNRQLRPDKHKKLHSYCE